MRESWPFRETSVALRLKPKGLLEWGTLFWAMQMASKGLFDGALAPSGGECQPLDGRYRGIPLLRKERARMGHPTNEWSALSLSESEKDGGPGTRGVCSRGPGEKN